MFELVLNYSLDSRQIESSQLRPMQHSANLFASHFFLPVNKDESITQLKLALAWNRPDVAETDIFTEDKKWQVRQYMHCARLQYFCP